MSNDLGGSSFNYTLEFVDLEKGTLVAEYKTEVSFTDFDDSDGDSSKDAVPFKSYGTGDFSPQSSGLVGISNITFTGNDLISALGLSAEDLAGGGKFDVTGTITTVSGQVFTSSNSSPTVNGAGFRGFFDYTLFVVCPSSLEGTYNVVTVGTSTDPCCPSETTLEGTITLTATGGGEYTISDWSGGLYFAWYGPGGGNYGINGPSDTEGAIKDACNVISLLTDAEPFGSTVSGDGRVNEDGTISFKWLNGFADKGSMTLTPQ